MRIIKKVLSLVVVIYAVSICYAAADSREPSGILNVGIDTISIPYVYIEDSSQRPYTFYLNRSSTVNNDKNLKGLDIELFNEIARIQNLKFKYKVDSLTNLLSKLEKGELDVVISGITITRERESKYLFTTPYLTLPLALSVLKENEDKYGSLKKIDGHVVCTRMNSASELFARNHLKYSTIKHYSSYAETFELVRFGLCAGAISDTPIAKAYAYFEPDLNLKIIPLETELQKVGIAINKKRPEIKKKIQNGLDRLKDIGMLNKLIKKYFPEMEKPESDSRVRK